MTHIEILLDTVVDFALSNHPNGTTDLDKVLEIHWRLYNPRQVIEIKLALRDTQSVWP
jgi:hypothetical protein